MALCIACGQRQWTMWTIWTIWTAAQTSARTQSCAVVHQVHPVHQVHRHCRQYRLRAMCTAGRKYLTRSREYGGKAAARTLRRAGGSPEGEPKPAKRDPSSVSEGCSSLGEISIFRPSRAGAFWRAWLRGGRRRAGRRRRRTSRSFVRGCSGNRAWRCSRRPSIRSRC